MALIKDSLLFQVVRGTLGKEVTIYERNGQIIMAKKRGKSKKKPTQKQLEARYRMQAASLHAVELLKDPEIKAYYQSKAGPGQNAYNMAVKDAYSAPEIQNIKLEDNTIVITAKDEFRVAEVNVRIVDMDGVIQDSGKAVSGRNGVHWYYNATTLPEKGTIIVSAVDLPGNETRRALQLE